MIIPPTKEQRISTTGVNPLMITRSNGDNVIGYYWADYGAYCHWNTSLEIKDVVWFECIATEISQPARVNINEVIIKGKEDYQLIGFKDK